MSLLVRCLLCNALAVAVSAAEQAAPLPTRDEVSALIDRAQGWLLDQQQPDGSLVPGHTFTLGITEMALAALLTKPQVIPVDGQAAQKALAYIKGFAQKDGGIYDPNEGLGNYSTSLALQVFAFPGAASPEIIDPARQYVLGQQSHEAGSQGEGGIGYGDKGPGFEDLSNTSYAMEGLRAAGVPATDPHLQEAVKFLERCQNLSSVNQAPWVANDGGAVYSPSEAGGSWETKDDGQPPKFTSSGTMTYSLISSYLALDLKPDDIRLKAALGWVLAHYRFDANPGMAPGKEQQGLFYYYVLTAKTMSALGRTTIALDDGRTVDWRADLFAAIRDRAQPSKLKDGKAGAFWINSASRWGEGMPHLTTAYMVKALKAIAISLER